MRKPDFFAKDLARFLSLADRFTKQWYPNEPNWGPWFRGQKDAAWSLQPKLYRGDPLRRAIRSVEDEIRQEFMVRAPSLSSERPQNSWDWYSLMRHCGAPTRFLDWTEGALIALYFAVRDRESKSDAAVWVLEPWVLNKSVLGKAEVIAPGAESGLREADAERYEPWLPKRYASKQLEPTLPVAMYPTHFARRISSQRSCFTIHGSAQDGFELLRGEASSHLVKIVIPQSSLSSMYRSLSIAGIDEVTVYPDLDGLGRWLDMLLRDEDRA